MSEPAGSGVGGGARRGVGVLLALGAAVTVGTLPVFLVAAMAVQIRGELGFSVVLLGVAVSAFFAAASCAARPLVLVTDRFGASTALRIAVVSSAVCLVGLALVPSTPWLLAGLCLAGLPNALGQPATNEIIMSVVPAHRRGLAFAVKQSAIPAATLLGGAAVPLVALTVGWRWVFVGAGVIGLLAALTVPRVDVRDRAHTGPGQGRGRTSVILVALAAVTGLGSAAAAAMATFLTTAAFEAGFDPGTAGLMLSLGSAFGLVSRLLVGWVADHRRGTDLLRTVTLMLAVGAVGLALLAVGTAVTFLVGLVLAFAAGWAWPGIFNFAVAARHPDQVARATSVTQTGVYLGAGLGPVLFGLVAGHFGTDGGWITACLTMLLGAALLRSIRVRDRRRPVEVDAD